MTLLNRCILIFYKNRSLKFLNKDLMHDIATPLAITIDCLKAVKRTLPKLMVRYDEESSGKQLNKEYLSQLLELVNLSESEILKVHTRLDRFSTTLLFNTNQIDSREEFKLIDSLEKARNTCCQGTNFKISMEVFSKEAYDVSIIGNNLYVYKAFTYLIQNLIRFCDSIDDRIFIGIGLVNRRITVTFTLNCRNVNKYKMNIFSRYPLPNKYRFGEGMFFVKAVLEQSGIKVLLNKQPCGLKIVLLKDI